MSPTVIDRYQAEIISLSVLIASEESVCHGEFMNGVFNKLRDYRFIKRSLFLFVFGFRQTYICWRNIERITFTVINSVTL